MPGVFLLTAGLVYCYAAYRREGGDGGRADARKAAASAAAGSRKMPAKAPPTMWQNLMFLSEFNPVICMYVYRWNSSVRDTVLGVANALSIC